LLPGVVRPVSLSKWVEGGKGKTFQLSFRELWHKRFMGRLALWMEPISEIVLPKADPESAVL
jgi:hypothetical protein